MKNLTKLFLVLILSSQSSVTLIAQDKYFTREGHISFHSEAEDENIEANNYKVTSIIDSKSGKMEFAVLMKAFDFEKSLMQEHFNENYVESDKYPKATFKGTVADAGAINWTTDGEYDVVVKGILSIHGVSKEIEEKGIIIVQDGVVTARSKFLISIKDYDIKIPKLVVKNIAEKILINVDLKYEVFQKS